MLDEREGKAEDLLKRKGKAEDLLKQGFLTGSKFTPGGKFYLCRG